MDETQSRPICVIAFFGIDRRLDITSGSILENIVSPAQALFDVRSIGHLWSVRSISNQRSGEVGDLVPPRVSLLPDGEYMIEAPLNLVSHPDFDDLCGFGDFWQDGFNSLSNLYSQLVSLHRVTEMALKLQPKCVAFVRADLIYHDSLGRALKAARESLENKVLLPHWQPHGGFNDRFGICCGERAIRAYGLRLKHAREFCELSAGPLHSERLVRFAIGRNDINVRRIRARASRVRIDSGIFSEDFSSFGWKLSLREILGKIRQVLISWQSVKNTRT